MLQGMNMDARRISEPLRGALWTSRGCPSIVVRSLRQCAPLSPPPRFPPLWEGVGRRAVMENTRSKAREARGHGENTQYG